jgi:hypothetical protein
MIGFYRVREADAIKKKKVGFRFEFHFHRFYCILYLQKQHELIRS